MDSVLTVLMKLFMTACLATCVGSCTYHVYKISVETCK